MKQEMYTFACGCQWPIVGPPPRPGALPLLDIDTENLPFCPRVWEILGQGDTKGVFQLESYLGKKWTRMLQPESGEHIGALGSILRPGCLRAMVEGVSITEHYCLRKNGQEDIPPYHPVIDEILKLTYGCLCYQEQCLEIARRVAGFNLQEADALRKSIGQKIPEEMAKCKILFLEGAARQKVVPQEIAEELFNWIEKSQRYQFNKSHAMSYGLIGYDTAYCKAHGPVYQFANWLRFGSDKPDPLQETWELVQDARQHDIQVNPPDLRMQEAHFQTDGLQIWFGLTDIKGVGEKQMGPIRAAIAQAEDCLQKKITDWSWLDFLFFCSAGLAVSLVIRLIKTGALDWMKQPRQWMLDQLDHWSGLTDNEREWIAHRELAARGLLAMEVLYPLPEAPVAPEEPVLFADENEVKAYKENVKKYKARLRNHQSKCEKILLQREQKLKPYACLEDALVDVGKTRSEGGGTATKKRTGIIQSRLSLLQNKTSLRVDRPDWIAWEEEELLGVALTCTRVDAFDSRDVNTTCKEYAHGKIGYMVLGVQIEKTKEIKTKNGKNPGSLMAFLTVSDSTCLLANVVCFSNEYKLYRDLLREGNCIYMQGERHEKNGSFIIKKVSLMEK